MAAGWFWAQRGLNELADRDQTDAISYRINGGWNGRDHRRGMVARAKASLSRHEPQVLLVPMGGGDPVPWDGRSRYAGQDLTALVPQLRQAYPVPGGPWEYGGVLRVWVRQSGDMVLERIGSGPTDHIPATPTSK